MILRIFRMQKAVQARILHILREFQPPGRQERAGQSQASALSDAVGRPRKPQGPQSDAFYESGRPSGPEAYVFYEVCGLWEASEARILCILRVQKAFEARFLRILRGLEPSGRQELVANPQERLGG